MNEILEPEVMPNNNNTTAIMAYEKAQIDTQIATAKQYPMHGGAQISKVKADMMSLATLDQETAEACFYSLPRGGKNIQGPSIRLAEIALSCYGNIKAGTRILETVTTGDSPHVTVQAICHDLEKNTSVCIEKRRRIVRKKDFKTGARKAIDEDDINLATNACSSIAFRDAAFKVIPLAIVRPVLEQAKKVAIGDAKTLADRRVSAVERFAKMGVRKEQILALLGKGSVEDIDLNDLETLLGVYTAIKEGETTIDDAFRVTAQATEQKVVSSDTIKAKKKAKEQPKEAVDTPANADESTIAGINR